MFKMIIVFLAFWGFVTGAIGLWRQMENKERWSLVKTIVYGFLTACITFTILTTIVILF
jgi:hypothetical protein